jgi:AbrB family looped-hinge helix DNA binding protein
LTGIEKARERPSILEGRRRHRLQGLARAVSPTYSYFRLASGWSAAMASPDRPTTFLSTKGRVILPKTIREQRCWAAGTRLTVEQTADGVLLKAAPLFAPTRPEDVFASLATSGPPKTLEEMEAGIAAEAKRRHAIESAR